MMTIILAILLGGAFGFCFIFCWCLLNVKHQSNVVLGRFNGYENNFVRQSDWLLLCWH